MISKMFNNIVNLKINHVMFGEKKFIKKDIKRSYMYKQLGLKYSDFCGDLLTELKLLKARLSSDYYDNKMSLPRIMKKYDLKHIRSLELLMIKFELERRSFRVSTN